MGFMVLDPNNDRGHQTDVTPEKGQEYQAVRIFGKDNSINFELMDNLCKLLSIHFNQMILGGKECQRKSTGLS